MDEGGGGTRAVRVRVTGRVQGVGFRAWTAAEAAAVRDMIAALREGPRLARVDGVEARPAEAPERPGFHVLR
jgi:acylphosphatase